MVREDDSDNIEESVNLDELEGDLDEAREDIREYINTLNIPALIGDESEGNETLTYLDAFGDPVLIEREQPTGYIDTEGMVEETMARNKQIRQIINSDPDINKVDKKCLKCGCEIKFGELCRANKEISPTTLAKWYTSEHTQFLCCYCLPQAQEYRRAQEKIIEKLTQLLKQFKQLGFDISEAELLPQLFRKQLEDGSVTGFIKNENVQSGMFNNGDLSEWIDDSEAAGTMMEDGGHPELIEYGIDELIENRGQSIEDFMNEQMEEGNRRRETGAEIAEQDYRQYFRGISCEWVMRQAVEQLIEEDTEHITLSEEEIQDNIRILEDQICEGLNLSREELFGEEEEE